MNKDKRNNIQLLGTLNNSDESGIIANANQIYDANEDKSTQDVSKEHKERIETLETTLENITKTGEASAASNVTYNHNDSQLDASNVQQAIDEVYSKGNTNRENDKTELEKSISDNKVAVDASIQDVYKKSNYNDGDNIIDFNTIHLITDNPEFICVAVDANDKILYGIKTDGQPYFGVGCPQQVKDYIDEQINKILGTDDITTTIDSLKEIEAFLKDFTNSDTLKKLLDLKANVDEVRTTTDDIYKKSNPNDSDGNVINTNTIVSVEDNPEYIKALTDSVGKLMEAIGLDGVRKFFAGINIQGVGQYVTNNPEYIVAWLDSQDRIIFAIKTDGQPYYGAGVPQQVIDYIEEKIADLSLDEYEDIVAFLNGLEKGDNTLQNLLDEKVDKEEGKSLIDSKYASTKSTIDNPEFLEVKTDAEDKVLEGIQQDGTKVIGGDLNVGGSAKILGNMEISGVSYKVIENPEYLAAWVDAENKVIFGFRADGKTYVGDAYFLNDIKNNQDAIAEIKPLIDKFFNGKKVSILGDSISTFNQKGYMIPGYAMYYPIAVGDRGADVVSVNDTWWMQVINSIEGVLEVNASFSGSTASNRAIGFSPRVPLLGNPDIIYIALGTNDSFQAVPVGEINFNAQSYDLSQFAPAYIKGMQDTIAAYPKAKIICIAFDMEIDYQNAIKIIAEHYGAEYIYVGDITDVHPNKSEMTAAANKISPAPQIYFENNPEYIKVLTDTNNKILEDIEPDGTHKFNNKVNLKGTKVSTTNYENYSQLLCDKDNKIIDSIDDKGTVTHNTKHIFKNGIEDTTGGLKKEALQYAIDNISDLAKALKDGGYPIIATDWSDYISNDGDNPLHLPEPRCAILNIISDVDLTKLSKVGLVAKSEEGKRYNVPVEVQYWDKLGNYFKKKAYISGQGRSSMGLLKKNIAIDFFDSEYNGDAFATRIGNWVAQDSYHLKAYYTDFLKGAAVVAYKFGDLIDRTNEPIKDRPWKKALINPNNVQTVYSKNSTIDDMSLQIDNNALCHPDGFPVIVYQNGSFYGIFAWQLKKHRDNYHLNKKKATNIHLDGTIRKSNFFGGNIDWTSFEIRNPKNLYYKEPHGGTYEYNADITQAEIAGDDEVNAWIEAGQLPDGTKISSKIKGYLQNTAKVKNHIVALSNHQSEIDSASTDEEKKAIIEKYFDIDTFIDYLITNCILYDGDAYDNNWQWITYDGVKWYVCEYDKDQSLGNRYHGMSVCPPVGVYLPTSFAIIGNIATLYKDKLVSRGKELIDANVINSTTLVNLLKDWIIRIGYNNYNKEYNKWTEAPCNRDDKVDNDYWERNTNYLIECAQYSSNLTYSLNKIVSDNDALYKSLKTNNSAPLTDTTSWEKVSYDPTITYNIGDTCYVRLKNAHLAESFKAVATTSSNPISGYYDNAPYSLGYRDNVWRFINFINYQVNAFIEYINNNYKNN